MDKETIDSDVEIVDQPEVRKPVVAQTRSLYSNRRPLDSQKPAPSAPLFPRIFVKADISSFKRISSFFRQDECKSQSPKPLLSLRKILEKNSLGTEQRSKRSANVFEDDNGVNEMENDDLKDPRDPRDPNSEISPKRQKPISAPTSPERPDSKHPLDQPLPQPQSQYKSNPKSKRKANPRQSEDVPKHDMKVHIIDDVSDDGEDVLVNSNPEEQKRIVRERKALAREKQIVDHANSRRLVYDTLYNRKTQTYLGKDVLDCLVEKDAAVARLELENTGLLERIFQLQMQLASSTGPK